MTNKPMLSVERELLENIALGLEKKGFGINWAVELRALLDNPVFESEVDRLERRCKNAELALKVQTENCEALKAAQHQGEPVAWSLEVEGYTTVLYENYQKALSEQEHFRGRGRTAEIHPLHREQPAPVAVVLPEKKSVPEPEDYNTNIDEVAFAEGYNDALDDVARLNGVKP